MTPFAIFAVQSTFSLVVFALLARWYVAPRLARKPLHDALVPLIMLHAFRYTPLTLLVPGQVEAAVPDQVATSIAYGDLASAGLPIDQVAPFAPVPPPQLCGGRIAGHAALRHGL